MEKKNVAQGGNLPELPAGEFDIALHPEAFQRASNYPSSRNVGSVDNLDWIAPPLEILPLEKIE